MPASDNQVEAKMETNAPTAEAPAGFSAKELAAMEEVAAKNAQASVASQQDTTEPIVSIAAQGREALMQRLREHMNKKAAEAPYVPPPRTANQAAALSEEQLAGQRALARAAAQAAYRPPPPTKEAFEKTPPSNTPQYRPGSLVPDPTVPAPSGFAAGQRQYGPDA